MLVSPAPLTPQMEGAVPAFEFSQGIGLTSANEQGSEAALAVGNTPAFKPKVTPTINAAAARSIVADSLLCIPRYVPPGHQDQHLDGRRRTRCSPDANRPHCGWLYHSSSVLSCKAVMMAPW